MVRFMPLVWAALWRNRIESVLTLLALSVAFALFGTMITLNAAYQRAIEDTRMDRLIVACAFDCGAIPLGYREQLARIPGVTAVGAQTWLGGRERDAQHPVMVMFVDQGMRSAWPELPLSPDDWRALDANPSGIFLSRQAAARRALRAGDTLAVTTDLGSNRADGNPAWYFTVLDFIPDPPGWRSGVATPAWNPDTIVGNLSYWENSAHAAERDTVVLMRVAVDRPEHARAVCREIEARFTNATPALYCVPARDDAEETADANINMRQISLGIGAAGLFMILFLCANGVAESVRERLPEFGVLKAMGYGDGRIAALVILEAALPTVLAALIGSALARAVDALVAHLVIKGVIDMPEVNASIGSFGWALAAALLIALSSAVAPLYRLRHVDVAAVMAGR
ncbi:MAG TPA: ABC transporter permease [Steroidobacteraceae bacterium]|nr:ABC transporter permease [Steroidobacteraceae bacterium]